MRDGFWYLVGFDHGRRDRRTYRIDRIESDVQLQSGSTFERPANFDPREAIPDDPKLIGADDSTRDARVWIDRGRAAAAVRELGEDRVVERRSDGSIEFDVPCAHLPAFRSWLLGYLEHAEVLAPDSVRQNVIDWLEAVAT